MKFEQNVPFGIAGYRTITNQTKDTRGKYLVAVELYEGWLEGECTWRDERQVMRNLRFSPEMPAWVAEVLPDSLIETGGYTEFDEWLNGPVA